MMIKKIILKGIAIATLAILSLPAYAKPQKTTILDIKESITDNSIVFPESYETDSRKMLEGWYMKNYTATDDRYKTQGDVEVPDSEIIRRLKAMPTVIEMPFNQIVRQYIERYTKHGRPQVAALLGLSHYYMPIFEQALEEKGLPLELKYLPVIESALDPNAVSKSGAAGLWQFVIAAAKGMGLEVNSLVDMRRDPYISSATAATLLKDLYATYGDWSLAIAAYNCGSGTVNKAIRRAGGDASNKDFWSIYQYLPAETRGYVPMFIAANYVMTYYKEHNISPVLVTKPLITDTVAVNSRIHFNQISKVLDIPVEELRVLNPQFRADIIPASPEQTYYLILPSQQIYAFIMSEDDIIRTDAEKYAQREVVEPGEAPSNFVAEVERTADDDSDEPEILDQPAETRKKKTNTTTAAPANGVHKVKAGESLASIAEMYGVSPEDIKSWNGLTRNAVRTGQQLKIAAGTPAKKKSGAETRTYSLSEDSAQSNNRTSTSSRKQKETASAETAKANAGKAKTADKTSTTKGKKGKSAKGKKSEKKAKPASYTIREGENLTVIARKHGVSVDDLKKANGLTSDNLRAGKTLKIPAKEKSSKKSKKKSARKKSGKRR